MNGFLKHSVRVDCDLVVEFVDVVECNGRTLISMFDLIMMNRNELVVPSIFIIPEGVIP